ncbi:hypothetical protein Tco_0884910 [Tanacetum coccineum]
MYHNLNQLQWQLERDNFHAHASKTCLVNFNDGNKWEPENYRRLLLRYLEEIDKLIDESVLKYEELWMKESEVQAIKEIENRLKESELQQQESLITKGAATEVCLVTEGATLEACLVNESIALNDNTVATKSNRTESENSSSETPFIRLADENRFSDKESSSSEGNDADADIGPSYDSDTVSKIKILNDEISNLKSQACEKDKTFAKENEKLRKAGQTGQTLRMFLPKEDNVQTVKQGLGFENQNDNVNPSVLNKAKELAPSKVPLKRRNVNLKKHLEQTQNLKEHLEQAQLRDHDPNLWNSLLMKYFCYVKQAMIKFEKQTFSKLELNQDELFRMNFEQIYEQNINTRVRTQLSAEFEPLVKNVNFQLNCFEKSLVKEMKDDLKYVMSLETSLMKRV